MTQEDNKATERPPSKLFRSLQSAAARCLVLILFGVAVHIPSLTGELLWDDIHLVEDNPLIKSPVLIWEAFRHYLFPDAYAGHYRPIQTISYIFDYFLWNKNPYGYHLSNVLWHILSGVLLYFLLCRILRSLVERWPRSWANPSLSSGVAFFLALLWLVHPVHSAAVDYISGRADSLAFSFACGGWLLYWRARELTASWARRSLFVLAAASASLSLCARETGALWILMFLLHLFAFQKNSALRTKLCVLAVCLGVTASSLVLRQLPEHHPEKIAPTSWTPAMRSLLMVRALGDYGRLLVFPSQLHIERSVWEPALGRGQETWRNVIALHGLSIGGVLVFAGLLFGAMKKGAGQRLRLFGASWFFLTFLPISNLFDLNATVAEHWLYLPSVGALLFVAGILCDLPARWLRPAFTVACLGVVGLSARSAIRSSDWKDPETFFRRTFAAGGSNSRIGVNLAVIYATRGDHAKAEAILRKVLEVSPEYPLARNNLALALSAQGKTQEAKAMFESAAARVSPQAGRPATSDGARNLARLRHMEKEDSAALGILDQAVRDFPGDWELVRLQAEILRETQGATGALPVVQHFVREHWWHAGASIALGGLLLETGEVAQATEAFRQASRLDVYDTDALNLLAMISVEKNELEEAWQIQRRAVARQPEEPRQHLILSDILEKLGRPEEAKAAAAEAQRLQATAKSQAPNVAAN